MSRCGYVENRQGGAMCGNVKLARKHCIEFLLDENWEYGVCSHKEVFCPKQREWVKKELEYWGVA